MRATSMNTLAMQDQIATLRSSAEQRDRQIVSEMKEIATSTSDIRMGANVAIAAHGDKFEGLTRRMCQESRASWVEELDLRTNAASEDNALSIHNMHDKLTQSLASAMGKHDAHVASELGSFMAQAREAFNTLTEVALRVQAAPDQNQNVSAAPDLTFTHGSGIRLTPPPPQAPASSSNSASSQPTGPPNLRAANPRP